jgi:hypothetical protein
MKSLTYLTVDNLDDDMTPPTELLYVTEIWNKKQPESRTKERSIEYTHFCGLVRMTHATFHLFSLEQLKGAWHTSSLLLLHEK